MGLQNYDKLIESAENIRTAVEEASNSAQRVGQAFKEVVVNVDGSFKELEKTVNKKAEQTDLLELTSELNGVFHAESTEYDIWKERILAAFIQVQDESLYYSPAIYNKTPEQISISIYSSTNKSGAEWKLITSLVWKGDTTVSQIIEISNSTASVFINPSRFEIGSFSGITHKKAGFVASVFNHKNSVFLTYSGFCKAEEAYSLAQEAEKIKHDFYAGEFEINFEKTGYINSGGNFIEGETWSLSTPIQVMAGKVYFIRLWATTIMGAVMAVDQEGHFSKHLSLGYDSPDSVTEKLYVICIPEGVEYIMLGNRTNTNAQVKFYESPEWIEKIYEKPSLGNTELELEWIEDEYISRSGKEKKYVGWKRTDFIPVSNWKTINLSGKWIYGSDVNNLSFYNKNQEFIGGWYSSAKEALSDEGLEIEIPEGGDFIRICNFNNEEYFSLSVLNRDILYSLLNQKEKEDMVVEHKLENWYPGYINRYGIAGGESWWHTDFIPITAGGIYFLTAWVSGAKAVSSGVNLYSFYEEKDESTFIEGLDIASEMGTLVSLSSEPLEIPSKANYVRLCGNTSHLDKFKWETSISDMLNSFRKEINQSQIVSDSFALPEYLDTVIGRNNDIFLDGISSEPDAEPTTFLIKGNDANAPIQRRGNSLRHVPVEESVPALVTFNRVDKNLETLYSSQMTFRPVLSSGGNGTEERNICICGDSLVDAGYPTEELYALLQEDGDFLINEIGTRGNNSKHEGRGSWSWATYVNPLYEETEYSGKKNAFMSNGELNFQEYFSKNFPDLKRKKIDYFIMALGTNDVSQGSSIPTRVKYNQIIKDAKQFIDALLSVDRGFPACKIAIGLCGVGAPHFPTTNTSADIFRRSIQLLNKQYIQEFDNGKYHPNVTTVLHGAYIDRYNSYPYIDEAVNDYITDVKVRRFTNSVHPLKIGYRQWGRGYYGKIRAFLSGVL